jgi:hypothetical protein
LNSMGTEHLSNRKLKETELPIRENRNIKEILNETDHVRSTEWLEVWLS